MTHQKPSTTIFADASGYPKQKVAGFGCWVISDDKRPEIHSGKLSWSPNSNELELFALFNALEFAFDKGFITPETKAISLQSDSLGALNVLARISNTYAAKVRDPKDAVIRPSSRPLGPYVAFASLLSNFEIVYLKHVKGHSSGSGRNTVNERCDKAAKQAARAQFRIGESRG